MTLLKFARGNAKLDKRTAIFSLPAGHTCPFAKLCLSKVDKVTGKLTDGKFTQFRCFAASAENLFTNVRKGRWNNFELLRGKTRIQMARLIRASLPQKAKLVRIHASGDFFNQSYFDAWLFVALARPDVIFYGYTKALPFWIKRLDRMPDNFRLVASIGGTFDNLIDKHNLRTAKVVFSEQEARKLKLKIDHNDSLVWNSKDNFALLLHGTQPIGTEAAKAQYKLRKQGKNGYKSDYFAHYGKVTKKQRLAAMRLASQKAYGKHHSPISA